MSLAPYGRSHRRYNILNAVFILELFDEDDDEDILLTRCLLGTKIIKRMWESVKYMFTQPGGYAMRAWKSDLDQFNLLCGTLRPFLEEQFGTRERLKGETPNGVVSNKLRLSAAIQFYSGASVYDLILSHGLGRQTIYNNIY